MYVSAPNDNCSTIVNCGNAKISLQTKPTEEEVDEELDETGKNEDGRILELGSKKSLLSGVSVGSADRLPGVVRRQISSASTGERRKSSSKRVLFHRQASVLSAIGRQTSVNIDGKDVEEVADIIFFLSHFKFT